MLTFHPVYYYVDVDVLVGAWCFYEGYEATFVPFNETVEIRSDWDSQDHETHGTASIIACYFIDEANVMEYVHKIFKKCIRPQSGCYLNVDWVKCISLC